MTSLSSSRKLPNVLKVIHICVSYENFNFEIKKGGARAH